MEVPEPEPGPGEVRVAMRAAAFNRVDRFTLAGIPGVSVALPHVLGSDGAGVVDRWGDGVTGLSAGQPVLLNPGLWDGTCEACRQGHEALCRSYRIVGEHTQGTATRFVVLPRRNVHPLPERLSFAEGAAAPLVFQTAWRAMKTVGAVRPGDRVAVVGAGGGAATAVVQV
ncbi:MAG: alcohol dehydrogenase catalytic domain-containing protein, partial [Thermoplasmata archaeon]